MMKSKLAVETFDSGYNCAQSVLTPFMKELNIDEQTVLRMSSGFGAGMGRLQETCGAITGAYMVLGLKFGKQIPDDESKEKVVELIQEFTSRFKSDNHHTNCRDLLHCDLNTEEGQEYFEQNNLHTDVCSKCVGDAVRIIEELEAD
jgi:C_GCAxxG_C_C family probable redox protein